MTPVTLAIDIMGGDHGPAITYPAMKVAKFNDLSLTYAYDIKSPNKAASLTECGRLLANGTAQAVVSAGDTRRLVASARAGLLPGLSKAPLVTTVPTPDGPVVFLDMGATDNTCTADDLLGFACLGHIYARHVLGRTTPSISLLSNGTESGKGSEVLRAAAKRIGAHPALNYAGFAEATFIAEQRRTADVIITDGFTGNIALKAWEGAGKLLKNELRAAFTGNWRCKLAAWLVRNELHERLAPYRGDANNGAVLLGLNRVIVKSHGSAGAEGFANAIRLAGQLVRSDVIGTLREGLPNLREQAAA